MIERCWHNRFSLTEPRCPKPGVWGSPDAALGFVRAMRWCDEHKRPGDIYCPIEDDDRVPEEADK